jgi:AcrR family transcriptional regulator
VPSSAPPPQSRADAGARVTRERWIEAAVATFRAGGLAAVRVEAVARALGVTKGSFYWHFTDRRALVDAVVARWEAEQTDEVIARTTSGDDARARLTALFTEVAARGTDRAGERHLYLEAAGEGVQDAVRRVTARRVEHVATLLAALGLPRDVARARAVVCLATVVGADQLADTLPSTPDRRALVRAALDMALAPA